MTGLALGAAEILEKPIGPEQMVEVVRDVEYRWRALREMRSRGTDSEDALLVPELSGHSPQARLLREQVATAARFPTLPVMITGETGTGKELVAHAIHRLTGSGGRMVSINCAAQPEQLWESEVFGHEPGAFTGAQGGRTGLFEAAGSGTVFLDEIGEMPPSQQTKLLRVVETRSFRRVGSNREMPFMARIISATNRPLRGRADEPLRSDLFFRLSGFTIRTPALRTRMEDIEPLADGFLSEFGRQYAAAPRRFSRCAIEALRTHDWPGNVRELRLMVQFAAVRATSEVLSVRHVVEAMRARDCITEPDVNPRAMDTLRSGDAPRIDSARPNDLARSMEPPASLRDIERGHIEHAYAESGRNISVAARRLGIPRTTLRDKLARYGLR
jgi:DNA-binding NtrC family response regulator